MELRILGPLEVCADGRAVQISGAKRRALLAVLALHANRAVSVETLALALWGEDAPAGAVKAVQVTVSRLRRALGEHEVLETTAGGYRLVVDPGEVDVERFERALTAGREALAAGDPGRAAEQLRAALQLWRGAPLQEFSGAPFAPAEIRRLEELQLDALESLIDAELTLGRHTELVAELQRLTAEHPWRERLHAQLMLVLYRSGRQAEALEAYRRARRTLVEQLGIEPGSELRELHQAVLTHDARLDAPSATVERSTALPAAPNRTIGREGELRAVVERLRAGETRLLTLTGPGGVGKTRLALEAAHEIQDDFADGARFVRLTAVGRPQDVPGAIMGALVIVPLEGESPANAVQRFLAVKHQLLVLDNCEHLLGAASWVGELVAVCPDITVLATSREPLSVQAEQTHLVPPLALPAGELALSALGDVAAVRLFFERARAHDRSFRLGADNAAAVAEICRRLDGLPLAIELAAGRCGLLSPAEIAERLDTATAMAGAAPRDLPTRQRTLRATIDWSHDLLNAQEQDCFARMAVFSGGATLAAAEAITGAGIDTLDRLVAKSLLVRQTVGGGTRLGMLETIRAYAAERLTTAASEESVRARHYRYFLSLAERHANDRALLGPDLLRHLARLDPEAENVSAALEWAARQDDAGPLLELSVALIEYWMRRDRYADAVSWVEQALRRPAGTGDPRLRVRALSKLPWPLWALGRGTEAAGLLSEAEAIARTLADPATLAEALYNRAAIVRLQGRWELAARLADEALCCATAAGDQWLAAMASWSRLTAARSAEELRQRVEHTAAQLKDAGNVYHHASVFQMVGYALLCEHADDEATRYLQRAVPLVRQLNQPYLWTSLRQKAGLAALFTADTDAARLAFREQLALCRELVILPAASRGLAGLAAIATLEDELDRAARLTGAAAAHRYGEHQDAVDARLQATFAEPARARYGADAWDAALQAGTALDFQDAIAYALDETGRQQPARPARTR
jgi:predicted ATPase/DNA-binding SARP family transcriptional activator